MLEVGPDDEYLRHVLRVHGADILQATSPTSSGTRADEPGDGVPGAEAATRRSGVVLVRDDGDGVAQVQLDYVTPRYRDFSPGEFVWRRSGVLRDRGFRRVVTPPAMVGAYYERLGFRRDGESYVLEV